MSNNSDSDGDGVFNGWTVFFTELTALLTEGEQQFRIANQNYTEYIIHSMDMALSTCSYIKRTLTSSEVFDYCK